MKRALFAWLLALPLAAHALDLTPRRGTRDLEGVSIPVLYFTNGAKSIRYQPPAAWEVSGGGAELKFTPKDIPDADMRWRVIPRKPEEAATPETPEQLAKWAEIFLPPDAEKIELLETKKSPFELDARSTLEFVFTYALGGRRFNQSVCLCDFSETERFVVLVAAQKDDFRSVRDVAIASLFSWE